MSATMKTRHRARLQQTESNVQELLQAGFIVRQLEREKMRQGYDQLTPLQRYSYWTTSIRCRKPIHLLPKYTKKDVPLFVRPGYENSPIGSVKDIIRRTKF